MTEDMILHSNMLSYARSIQTGDALFYGRHTNAQSVIDQKTQRLNSRVLIPAMVAEISVRGQIGNYIADASNKEFNIEEANLQTIDKAKLPPGANGLVLKFAIQFLPNALAPHACNNPEVAANLETFAQRYVERHGFSILARRYLWNLVNGRWWWRNFLIAENKQIHLLAHQAQGETQLELSTNPAPIEREYYPGDEAMEAHVPGFNALAERISQALSNTGNPLTLEVVGEGSLPELSEIFPSEEFLSGEHAEEVKRRRGAKSPGKVLSSVKVSDGNGHHFRQPTFHPQKVGNAIRCIDEWHGNDEYGAVAVDPYAALTTRAIALREPKRGSLYDFLTLKQRRAEMLNVLANHDPSDSAFGNVHFVMANLVRGGVFGGKE